MLCWPFRLPFSALSRFPGGTLRSEILSAICSCLSLRRATLSIFTNRLTLYPFDRASVSTHLKDTIIVRIIMYRVINVKRYYLPYSIGDSFYCQQHSATTLCNFPLENCDSPRGRNPRRPPPSSSATILATLVITDIGHPVILVTPVCHSHRLCVTGVTARVQEHKLWIPPEASRNAEGGTTGFGENDEVMAGMTRVAGIQSGNVSRPQRQGGKISKRPARLSVKPLPTSSGSEQSKTTLTKMLYRVSSSQRRFTVSVQLGTFCTPSSISSAFFLLGLLASKRACSHCVAIQTLPRSVGSSALEKWYGN